MDKSRKNTKYYKSGKHLENIEKARELSTIKSKRDKLDRMNIYYQNPKRCLQCNKAIDYEKKRTNTFCSSSCSCTYNSNKRSKEGWKPSKEHKAKVSKSLKSFNENMTDIEREEYNRKIRAGSPPIKKFKITCKICKKESVVGYKQQHNKTCGNRDCRTKASVGIRTYQNGSRKTIWYFNKNENKDVLLESSWEVKFAKVLDKHSVHWVRPEPIKWFDSISNKDRLYYPDFYLKDYDLYFDPKNPYAMVKDKYKMEIVRKNINVEYGDINDMIEKLLKLL